jgi:hypothetical protein
MRLVVESIALIDPDFGEQMAQACEKACLQQSRTDCGCVTDNPWDSSFLHVQSLPLYGGHNT